MQRLKNVIKGPQSVPFTICIYGQEGVGKTMFASQAPNPIFLEPEGGSARFNVDRIPDVLNWNQAHEAIDELISSEHSYKTLVIDSIDWLERMMHDQLCRSKGVSVIQNVEGGFGKGETAAMNQWESFISKLKQLKDKKKMNILAIAHQEVKTFSDPEAIAPYDRFQLKIEKKSAALWREFVDCLLFARFETLVTKEKNEKKGKAFGEGKRLMYTEHRPAFDAKNRYNLPFEMALSWAEFEKAASQNQKTKEQLIKEILSLPVPEEKKEAMSQAVQGAKDDFQKLINIKNYAMTLINEAQQ